MRHRDIIVVGLSEQPDVGVLLWSSTRYAYGKKVRRLNRTLHLPHDSVQVVFQFTVLSHLHH